MAHPKETRHKLRQLYVSGQSLETSAQLCNVAFGTARRWKEDAKTGGDDWEKLRAAHVLSGGGLEQLGRGIIAGFLAQYQSTMEAVQNDVELAPTDKVKLLASLADAFTKTVNANARVLPETSKLATAMEVMQLLADFVQEKHPEQLAAFVEMLEPFGAMIEKKFG